MKRTEAKKLGHKMMNLPLFYLLSIFHTYTYRSSLQSVMGLEAPHHYSTHLQAILPSPSITPNRVGGMMAASFISGCQRAWTKLDVIH